MHQCIIKEAKSMNKKDTVYSSGRATSTDKKKKNCFPSSGKVQNCNISIS